MNDPTVPIRAAILALPESTAAALYGLYDVLSSYGEIWSSITGEARGHAGFRVTIVGPTSEPFRCFGDIPVSPHASFEACDTADVLLIPDVMMDLAADPRGRWPEACALIARCHDAGTTICTVCTGSVLLADTGLLDGRDATTYWGCTRMFGAHFPAVKLKAERMLVAADPDHRIVTAGGSSAWQDMALYLISRFCGQTEAVKAAKVFLLGDHSEGQLPYAAMIKPRQHGDAAIAASQEWIASHYESANPVARMMERSGLSERTFKRRFRAATGFTPVEYVQTLRIEEAKQYLETTDLNIDEIGEKVGYSDPAFFRRLFKRQSGTSPAAYRQRYAASAITAGI
ncbi:MAG: helix-turn-helix domain-containing protein [Alphaproteobacteria bacterium]|nr:helix-turn-helix domain-containing protein [Alphaproteobacteria bacterium]